MAIAGPRLDSPSAIGDDGRSRAASLWLATLVVAAIVGIVGVLTGEPNLLPMLSILVGCAVAGIALLDRESFAQLVVGHLLLVTFGSALSILVLVGPFLDRSLFVVAACALSLFGVVSAWADVGSDDIERALKSAAVTYLWMLITAIVVALISVVAAVGWFVLDDVAAQGSPLASVVGFLIVVAATAGMLLLSLRLLPVRQLTSRSRRPHVESQLAAARRGLRLTMVGAPVLLVVLAVLWIAGDIGTVVVQFPILTEMLRALSSPLVVVPLAIVGLGALFVGFLATAVRRISRQVAVESTRGNVAMTVGIAIAAIGACWIALVYFGASQGLPELTQLLIRTGTPIGALLLIGPITILLVGAGAVLAGSLELLPSRATGPAVAATGLLLVAIGLGAGEPILTFAAIAGALLVWDLSTFGLGLTAELGHLPETRRLELFHGAVAVGVAIGAVLLALGLEFLRTGTFAEVGATGGAVLIALGALLLLIPLRG